MHAFLGNPDRQLGRPRTLLYDGQITDFAPQQQSALNLFKLWRNATLKAILPGWLGSVTIKRPLWELV